MAIEGDTPSVGGTAEAAAAPKSAAELFGILESGDGQIDDDERQEPDADPHGEPEAEGQENAEAEAEAVEDPEAPEAEEKQAEESEALQAIEIDGQKIPLEEVRKGYLRQQDYTRKTQELAQNREEVGKAVERVTSMDQEARKSLEIAAAVVNAVLPPAPDISLIQLDPVSYLQQKEAREQAISALQQINQRVRQTDQRQSEQSSESRRAALDAEMKVLQERIPAFAQEGYRQKFRQEAVELGAKYYGLTADEIGSIASAKEIAVLRDAIEFRKLQSKTMSAVAKAKQAPKAVIKPGTRDQRTGNPMDALKALGRPPQARDIFALLEQGSS